MLWAPILLVHLGGQDGITAYNIEDNELWKRHVVTAVSQVSAADGIVLDREMRPGGGEWEPSKIIAIENFGSRSKSAPQP